MEDLIDLTYTSKETLNTCESEVLIGLFKSVDCVDYGHINYMFVDYLSVTKIQVVRLVSLLSSYCAITVGS